jgi:hypothetical protein
MMMRDHHHWIQSTHAAVAALLALSMTACGAPSAGGDSAIQAKLQKDHTDYPIELSPFGLHVIEGDLAGATDLGAKWTRTLVLWKWIEPQRGDFKQIDKAVKSLNQLSAAGIQVLPRIVSVNPWANQDRVNRANEEAARKHMPMGNWTYIGVPKDVDAYKAFITRVVEAFDGDGRQDAPGLKGQVKFWQVENEWDWRWQDSPEDFVAFLKTAYETIKQADPQATVVLGGISKLAPDAFADGYLGETFNFRGKQAKREDVMRNADLAKGYKIRKYVLEHGYPYFDVISFHQYGNRDAFDGELRYLHDLMNRVGYSKPIWITEAGGPFTAYGERYTPDLQAQEVVKYYVSAMAAGVQVLFWSTYMQTPEWGPSFANTALLDAKKQRKPAYAAYKTLNTAIRDATRVERILDAKLGEIVRFTRPDRGPVFVIWSNAGFGRRGAALKKIKAAIAPKLQGKTLRVTRCDGSTETVRDDLKRLGKLILAGPVFVEVQP